MSEGPLWSEMRAQPRRSVRGLSRLEIPLGPGVYSFFRDGAPIYVGKAASLQTRVGRHCGKGKNLRGSAFRRNVAHHLRISSPNNIYKGHYQPTPDELERIREWIEGCEVAWITRSSEAEAVALETAMKAEWMPPLTRI